MNILEDICILLGSAIEFLPVTATSRIRQLPLANPDFSRQVSEKIDNIGQGLYMTPIQKHVVDKFSIEADEEHYRKVIFNGHYGSGKTSTLIIGIKELVPMIQKTYAGFASDVLSTTKQ